VDWKQSYDAFADRIDATTRPEELFAVLCEMISPLDDPHASLSHGEQTCTKPLPDWLAMDSAGLMVALEEYVYGGDATRTANGAIAYRVLPENVGYVFIPSMGGYADSPQADVTVAEAALDEVVSAFADVEGVIVDVRFNGGGSDQISMLIADRFADQKRLGFSVRTRDGDSWTEERNYYVQPAGGVQLLKPAVVLTSEFTVSAAETFVLLMGELPHVTVMGDRTAGGLSNMMNRSLPNGMTFTLPLERNFAANGECYEGLGLTPDIVFAFEADAFCGGQRHDARQRRCRLDG
jgi:C-terminal processing protease CtpA/Prc